MQGVRREAESEGRKAKLQAEANSELAVAFRIDDPPQKRGSQLKNIRLKSLEG